MRRLCPTALFSRMPNPIGAEDRVWATLPDALLLGKPLQFACIPREFRYLPPPVACRVAVYERTDLVKRERHPMSDRTLTSIAELTRMAQFYEQHGYPEKAEQVMQLVERMVRSLDAETNIVPIHEYRKEHQRPA